jgi:hypothetical protein
MLNTIDWINVQSGQIYNILTTDMEFMDKSNSMKRLVNQVAGAFKKFAFENYDQLKF